MATVRSCSHQYLFLFFYVAWNVFTFKLLSLAKMVLAETYFTRRCQFPASHQSLRPPDKKSILYASRKNRLIYLPADLVALRSDCAYVQADEDVHCSRMSGVIFRMTNHTWNKTNIPAEGQLSLK